MASQVDRGPASPADEAARQQRNLRLVEVVDYALSVLGAESGSVVGVQRRLAEILDVSSTMIHRYRNGMVDFGNLRGCTIEQLARAANIHVGALYDWINLGRAVGMETQRRLVGRPVGFSPLDLVRELEQMLSTYRTALDPADAVPEVCLQYDAILAALDERRAAAPSLFNSLAKAIDAVPLLERLDNRSATSLEEHEWGLLGQLLDEEPADLIDRFLV